MRRSGGVLALIVALVAMLAGCGSSRDRPAGSPGDTVRVYHRAIAEGDGTRACDQLDARARKQLQDSTQGAARASCKQVIELLAAFYDQTTKQALRAVAVIVTAKGDSATATFTSPLGIGGAPHEQRYLLRKSGGGWKIDELPLSN